MTAVLGREPVDIKVPLITGSDYEMELIFDVDGVETDWPVGTVLKMVFENGVEFEATIDGSVARFAADKAAVAAVPPAGEVRVTYTNGTTDRVPMLGRAYRRG